MQEEPNPNLASSGLAVKTMHDRVALLGGSVHITAPVGQGSQIQVRLPLRTAPLPG
jgi:signal transduction histidine kinase